MEPDLMYRPARPGEEPSHYFHTELDAMMPRSSMLELGIESDSAKPYVRVAMPEPPVLSSHHRDRTCSLDRDSSADLMRVQEFSDEYLTSCWWTIWDSAPEHRPDRCWVEAIHDEMMWRGISTVNR